MQASARSGCGILPHGFSRLHGGGLRTVALAVNPDAIRRMLGPPADRFHARLTTW